MIDCVFCKKFDEECLLYSEEYETYIFEPLNPVTPGHLLFVPEAHVQNAHHHPFVTAKAFACAADYIKTQWGAIEDYNLITSSGDNATQTVHHLHVHLVPRRADDGLHLPWTGQMKG